MKATSYVIGGVAGMAVAGFVAHRRRRMAREEEAAREEIHQPSPTALAAEALRRGTTARPTGRRGGAEIPHEDALLQVGDPNVDPLETLMVGDEAPGGDMTTPDQDLVDDVGRAFGVAEADSGELRASAEILAARDRRRTQ